MKIYAGLDSKTIIIIIVIAAVVLIAAGVLLSFFVFSRNKVAKEVKALEKKFNHLRSLTVSQCSSNVRRIESISHSNLIYVETYSKFKKQFKEVKDKYEVRAETAVHNVRDLLADKKYKQLRADLESARSVVEEYETEVNKLNSELLAVVKPEDDCRQSAMNLKDTYRGIKNDYTMHQNELSLVSESYEKIFKYIDNLFEEFNRDVESASYDDANALLPKISKILHQLTEKGQELPNLVAQVNVIIPDKISSLENAYEVMRHDDYPLHHLTVNVNVAKMNETLQTLRDKIKMFETKGVAEQLEKISATIDDYFALFEEEKKAREEFENDNTDVYKSVNDIERRFIKLKNTIPEVSKIYVINSDYNAKINEIQTEINKVGASKRSLDTLIHSSTKQPYSILSGRMKELHKATDLVISDIEGFIAYLGSLKTDSETAYKTIHEYFALLKEAEKTLREINNEDLSNKYQPTLDHLYDIVSQVYSLLNVRPIDVEKLNENINQLHVEGDPLLGPKGEIAMESNMKTMAENAIIYANRFRDKLSDVDSAIKESEDLFNKGKYEESYRVSAGVLKRLNTVSED